MRGPTWRIHSLTLLISWLYQERMKGMLVDLPYSCIPKEVPPRLLPDNSRRKESQESLQISNIVPWTLLRWTA